MSLLPLALQAIREGEGSPAYQALSEAAAQGDRPYPYIIAVDFDGTLCENNWPEIGRENRKMLKVRFCGSWASCSSFGPAGRRTIWPTPWNGAGSGAWNLTPPMKTVLA